MNLTQKARGMRQRSAYTLLEVLVAFSIGTLILGGLYWAIDSQLQHADIARDAIEQAALSRSICQRIEADIQRSLGPLDAARLYPLINPSSSSSSSGTGSTGGGSSRSGGTARGGNMGAGGAGSRMAGGNSTQGKGGSMTGGGTGGSSNNGPGTGANGSTWTALDANSMPTSVVSSNLMLQGTNDTLQIYISRAPRLYSTSDGSSSNGLTPDGNQANQGSDSTSQDALQTQQTTDIRQVIYQVGEGPDGRTGLLRQEVLMTQADDGSGAMLNNLGQTVPAQLLAPEVKSVTFRYLDNNPQTSWLDAWPSQANDYSSVPTYNNGGSPIGPPMAIEVTLTITPQATESNPSPADFVYRHVIPILTANGPSLQTLGQQLQYGGNSQATDLNGQPATANGQTPSSSSASGGSGQ